MRVLISDIESDSGIVETISGHAGGRIGSNEAGLGEVGQTGEPVPVHRLCYREPDVRADGLVSERCPQVAGVVWTGPGHRRRNVAALVVAAVRFEVLTLDDDSVRALISGAFLLPPPWSARTTKFLLLLV